MELLVSTIKKSFSSSGSFGFLFSYQKETTCKPGLKKGMHNLGM
jgi:hypothetical protein